MRQHQETVRLQLFQQQQMLQYFLGCFGALYSHVELAAPPPSPLPPLDPAAPTSPAASLPQTPLAQFLEQQRQFQDFQQLSTAQSRPHASVVATLPVEALQFDSTSLSPLRPSAVRASVDSTLLSSLAASVSPQTESTLALDFMRTCSRSTQDLL
ncbi:hypothetical protein PVAP13_2NG143803 [Panicum virgatum]|uniref:Uncharacterized protein n=1 Tax=Panicum virgatum TaxID=38727 RepID=A0A8T0VP79_PANVG|nr:hypothetical protein PVAP13_2NG143803 [Panicum virgatum]